MRPLGHAETIFMMRSIDRAAFVAGVSSVLCAVAAPALAADAKPSFRCIAHLDRVRDKRTMRHVEVTVADGKRGDVIDGSWDYSRMPRAPLGLYAVFTASSGKKVHLKADFDYGSSGGDPAGGNNVLITDAKTSIEDDFDLGVPVAYPWKIAGEDYLLVVSVDAPAAK